MEEKGSDVNLAVHLLNDAWKKSFDAAVVVSNDTDLVTPIRIVTVERGTPVLWCAPAESGWPLHWRPSPLISGIFALPMLRAAQFPNIPGTALSKPATW